MTPMSWKNALLVAFLAGVSTMAIEMTASRLLAPAFGTSLAVWTNIIGVMMVALCVGYTVGGRYADKTPSAGALSGVILFAGLWSALIPLASGPVLKLLVEALALEEFTGSFVGTIVLFAVPIFLLGMVNPFAIRLAAGDVESVGRLSGQVYSVSTLGSLVGTFLPVLLTIPLLGTAKTMYLFSVLLIGTGLMARKLGSASASEKA